MERITLYLRDDEVIHWEGLGDYNWKEEGRQIHYYRRDPNTWNTSRKTEWTWDNYDIAYHLDGDVVFDILMAAIATDADPNDTVARAQLHEALSKVLNPPT